MKRVRLILAYDGTDYVGWQTQPNGVSVQETIEKALFEVTGARTALHGSGRTDSGVHAAAQVAHFDTEARMASDKFAIALNTHLPDDIRVLYAETCDPAFHARFCAKQKEYTYTVHLGAHADVFSRRYALQLHTVPDLPAMQQAAAAVLGTHDFHACMSAGTTIEDTVRTVTRSEWTQDGCFLRYTVAGNGFLYNMVRILVGTMLEIGAHKRPVSDMETAISSGKRTDAGATAPPHGLTLKRVQYPDFDTQEVLSRV